MARDGKNFSILLVNKDFDEPYFLRKSLEESPVFPSRIERVPTIEEALSRIERQSYDLLLLEAELEEETIQSLEKIRQRHVGLPFVLLLPVKDEKLLREAMRCGVADVIVKSESHFQQLAERLRKSYQAFENQITERAFPASAPPFENPEREEETRNSNLSVRDELTGLYTHSYLYERIVREFSAASRYHYPISCVMLDIDNFSKINEKFGYYAGERLLKEAANLLFENCRMTDFIARCGGKSFCMGLPHSGYEGARELAVRLKTIFADFVFLSESHDVQITVSVGVSCFPDDPVTQRRDLISFSQEALQYAKSLGRNRVCLFKEMNSQSQSHSNPMPSLEISEEKVAEFQRHMGEINKVFEKGLRDASKALIMALEAKDRHTVSHSASCSNYAFLTAKFMGMSPTESEVVRLGLLLHDIGKICIPDSILLKPGRLTLTEFETMKQHTTLGFQILKPFLFLREEALVVLYHHEWFNGEGYPMRLKGNDIPLSARIGAVVDSYDTIRSAGARYKRTSNVEDSANELIACAGTQFDPEVVRAFIEVLKQRGEITAEHQIHYARLEEAIRACRIPSKHNS